MNVLQQQLFGDGVHDDTLTIQRMLDKRGLVTLPHGTYLISKPLVIHSDTHLKLAKTTVLRLADGANCSLLDNDGLYSDQYNQNITIEGGIWDGNNFNQVRQAIPNEGVGGDENEDKPCEKDVYLSNVYLILMMRLVHVKNLVIKDLTYKDPTTFAVQIADVEKFTVENITLDYNLQKPNMDGIHVQGPASCGYIHNVIGNANDDHVALCANGTMRSAITHGAIQYVTVDGVYCDNGYTGVRLLSRGDPVKDVTVKNVHGAFKHFAVSFTHHYPLRDDLPVTIENVHVQNVFAQKSKRANLPSANQPSAPIIWVEGGVNVKNVVIENVYLTKGKAENVAAVVVEETAKTENLIVKDVFVSEK